MIKHTFQATAPDGSVFTRKSNHEYTHAVLVELNDEDQKKTGSKYGKSELSMHSSLTLAERAKHGAENWGVFKSVFIVEVVKQH